MFTKVAIYIDFSGAAILKSVVGVGNDSCHLNGTQCILYLCSLYVLLGNINKLELEIYQESCGIHYIEVEPATETVTVRKNRCNNYCDTTFIILN
jgi:hypothetical protein